MVAFLREHIVLALIVAYTLGQVTAVLVLGGLLPRDPGNIEETALRTRHPVRTPHRRRSVRFSFATPTRSAPRVSGSNRLRRFFDRESTIEAN